MRANQRHPPPGGGGRCVTAVGAAVTGGVVTAGETVGAGAAAVRVGRGSGAFSVGGGVVSGPGNAGQRGKRGQTLRFGVLGGFFREPGGICSGDSHRGGAWALRDPCASSSLMVKLSQIIRLQFLCLPVLRFHTDLNLFL